MEDSKYTPAVTTMLPGTRKVEALMKQKDIVVGDGLRIQSWFVQEDGKAPYLVQILGEDAELTEGGSYTVMLRERTQTRISDDRPFTELQVAAASAN